MAADNTIMMLGLAMKAGKVISGETGCENSIRDGSAYLVILAEDASANTMKKFKDKRFAARILCREQGRDKRSETGCLRKAQRAGVRQSRRNKC